MRQSAGLVDDAPVAISHPERLLGGSDGLSELVRVEVTLGKLPLNRMVRTTGIFLTHMDGKCNER